MPGRATRPECRSTGSRCRAPSGGSGTARPAPRRSCVRATGAAVRPRQARRQGSFAEPRSPALYARSPPPLNVRSVSASRACSLTCATAMRVGIPKETARGEARVAIAPDVVKRLARKDVEFVVEAGAGEASSITDDALRDAGATIANDASDVWAADVVAKVRAPTPEEIGRMRDG